MPSLPIEKVKATELPYALKLFLFLSVGLTILSLVFTILCRHLNMGLPYSFAYYLVPGDMFSDFRGFTDKFLKWGTPAFYEHNSQGYFMYPAPLVHVFRFFLHLRPKLTSFLVAIFAVTAYLSWGFIGALRKERLATMESLLFVGSTVVLSYPLLFLVQRGNIEFLVWLASSVAVWSFFMGSPILSAIFIGIAASLKPYPIIFLGLFLPRRKYWGFVLGIATVAVVTLVSLYGIGPTIAAASRWDTEQLTAFSTYYVGALWGLGCDHSFFGLVKALTLHWHPDYFAWARPYSITVAVFSVVLYSFRIWRLPLPNQILALSVLCVTIAPVSFDYTLVNLYPAFAMLAVLALQAQRLGKQVSHLTAYMVLFALIFTPESYVIYHGVRFAAQLRVCCLIVMLIMALRTPLPEREPVNVSGRNEA